jgi:hypothetical protein
MAPGDVITATLFLDNQEKGLLLHSCRYNHLKSNKAILLFCGSLLSEEVG